MQRPMIITLKVLLAVMLTVLVLCQAFLIPSYARQAALAYPEVASLEVPGMVIAILFIAAIEVVLLCVWRLLSLVGGGSIFSTDAFVWVDVIIGAVVAATLLIAALLVAMLLAGVLSSPVIPLSAVGIVVGSGAALLIVVMRGLLRNAAQLQQDLSEVV